MFSKTIVTTLLLLQVRQGDFLLYAGDKCMDDGNPGVCCSLTSCGIAFLHLQLGIPPTPCSFEGFTPIVCCRGTCSSLVTPSPFPDSGSDTTTAAAPDPNKRKSEQMCEQYDTLPRFKRKIYLFKDDEQTKTDTTAYKSNTLPSAEEPVLADDFLTTTPSTVYAEVGGTDALIHEFPHMAALGWPLRNGDFTFKCGGSLISDRFVLTAGHCLSLARDSSVASVEPSIVRLGDLNILDNVFDGATPVDTAILSIIPHPNYRPPLKYNDIALLKLQESVELSYHMRPACLWTKPHFETYTQATSTGWGTNVSNGRENTYVLQKVTLDILETNLCEALLKNSHNRNWKGFRDTQMCAGVLEGGKDSCQGDSGGPLQILVTAKEDLRKYYLIGVTSFGWECAKANLPGVYTRVSSFLDWIEPIVWS